MKQLVRYTRFYNSGKHREKVVFYQWYWVFPQKQPTEKVKEFEDIQLFMDMEAGWERILSLSGI